MPAGMCGYCFGDESYYSRTPVRGGTIRNKAKCKAARKSRKRNR